MNVKDLIRPFQRDDTPPPTTLMAFIRWALKGAWPMIVVAAILSGTAGAMEAVTAYFMGSVVDRAVELGPQAFFTVENVGFVLAVIVFFLIVRPITFGLSSVANNYVVMPNIPPLVLSKLNRWTLGQSVSFFDNDFAGRIAQKQMQTATSLTMVVSETISAIVFAFASLVGSLLLLAAIDYRVLVVFAVWLVAYFALIRWYLPRIRTRSAARAGARANVSGQVVDTITNIKTVKLFASDRHEELAAQDAMVGLREKSLAFGALSASFRFFLMILAGALPVILAGASLLLWRNGLATTGDVVATAAVAVRVSQMTGWVSFTLMGLYANVGEVENGMKTLAPAIRVEDQPNAQALAVAKGEIDFDQVTFAYGGETGGVKDIKLTVKPGEKLAVVGASGAGKSTLVSLLLRLFDRETGSISIDGQDIAEISQDSLRDAIGMVTQETAMFNRSAMENIRYGRPEATDEEVFEAARRASAHEFILELKDHEGRGGYDARLGERGVKLSGGQRQRIALARAILKDAPILVLDEATSALDSEVEAEIQEALTEVMQGKTVLAIAHRLSTIAQMDRIVVLEQGHIVEQGPHDVLLAQNGLYARFWARQSGGFLDPQQAAE
ncbi:ABC transporter ATP-binding protein [uncultured Pelagimonas sp.]|uniref:ABC transporter ATP-binding protein n=1 Tax=uncultured Pelagimonas sp. TaxID=1618102 RepID=UPI00261A58A0|nr:ABC transporter ATP-binding protein [uncultured Pelagimonas sp.]